MTRETIAFRVESLVAEWPGMEATIGSISRFLKVSEDGVEKALAALAKTSQVTHVDKRTYRFT